MAGSFSHIVGKDGRFTMKFIENLGDAHEALEECYALIYFLAERDSEKISNLCRQIGLSDPWENEYGDDPRKEMKV